MARITTAPETVPDPAPADIITGAEGTPTDAPTDAPDVTPDVTPDPAPAPAIDREALRAQTEAQTKAVLETAPRFTPVPGAEWADVGTGGKVCTCHAKPDAKGLVVTYLVYQFKGKETALPLAAIYAAEAKGLF